MNQQFSILKKSKKFIKDGHSKNKNVEFNPNYFLTSWSDSIGYINIKTFFNKDVSTIKKYRIILKEFFSINRDNLENVNRNNIKNYDNLVMTYFFPKNLKKDRSYDDKYFSINTNSLKKTLWILIPTSKNNINYKTNENIIILKRDHINFYKNIFISFNMLLKNLLISFFFLKNENIKFKNTNFSKNLSKIIIDLINKNKIKKFIFPYEAQPHQHFLVNKLKKNTKKVKTVGYMHTVIPPLPLDYIKRTGHPDLLLVNGVTQKNILCQKLGWRKKEVRNIISLRYKKTINYDFGKNIFLPYFLEDEEKMFNFFKKLVFLKKKKYFPIFKIRNHPSMTKSKKHLILEKKLNKFIKLNLSYFKNTKKNNKICLFFGSTASVVEGLERGYKVFHICNDPSLEKFDQYYWKKIKAYNLSSNFFEYKLKTLGEIIKFNTKKKISSLPI